jgi:Ca2+-binding EF-hand superfamily protein
MLLNLNNYMLCANFICSNMLLWFQGDFDKCFTEIDRNSDGKISKAEMMTFIKKLMEK